MSALRVFIGYDERQPIAYQVAAHSVVVRARGPVSVTPLILGQLPVQRRGLTAFTYSRFLVPWLCQYQGVAIFLDSDMLCRGDVYDLAGLGTGAVSVVMHDRAFERPSMMVYRAGRCRSLTLDAVRSAPLFDLAWADEIGALPREWNHLVGYDPPDPGAKLVHFTKGIPIWPETRVCEWADAWHEEYRRVRSSVSFEELLGGSVHVDPPVYAVGG